MAVYKIISGGQTGADLGGLKAAKKLGLVTGGWMPKGFLTLDGPAPELAREFRLQEHKSEKYPPRTRANVKESDATLRFAANFDSRGERCTLRAIEDYDKLHRDVDINDPPAPESIRRWLDNQNVRVLNVAGNTEKQAPGIEAFVIDFLTKVLARESAPAEQPVAAT